LDLRDLFLQEIHADRFLVVGRENAFAVPLNETGFTDGPVTHNHDLESVKRFLKIYEPGSSHPAQVQVQHIEEEKIEILRK